MDQASPEVAKELTKVSFGRSPKTASGWLHKNTSPDTAYLVFGTTPFAGLSESAGAVASHAERAIFYINSAACNRVRLQGFYIVNVSADSDTDLTFLPPLAMQAEQALVIKIINQLTIVPGVAPQPLKVKLGNIQHVFDTGVYVRDYKGHESRGKSNLKLPASKGHGGYVDLLECAKALCHSFNNSTQILR